ncbi:MAG: hypothetical protein LBD30_02390 [Verrucomicrobiales bacterium]|jgi:hypothetical protein|nr:hypothetical protein [Verrucomicrobiales bacterium]
MNTTRLFVIVSALCAASKLNATENTITAGYKSGRARELGDNNTATLAAGLRVYGNPSQESIRINGKNTTLNSRVLLGSIALANSAADALVFDHTTINLSFIGDGALTNGNLLIITTCNIGNMDTNLTAEHHPGLDSQTLALGVKSLCPQYSTAPDPGAWLLPGLGAALLVTARRKIG